MNAFRMTLCLSVFLALQGCAISPTPFKHPTVSGSPVRVSNIVSITKKDGDVVTLTVEHIGRTGLQGAYGVFVANNDMQSVTIHRLSVRPVSPPSKRSTAEEVSDTVQELVEWVASIIAASQ